jgi:hypothetical protein
LFACASTGDIRYVVFIPVAAFILGEFIFFNLWWLILGRVFKPEIQHDF